MPIDPSEHDDIQQERPFPRYVYTLNYLHNISLVLGPLGFFVLACIALYFGARHGPYNAWAIGLNLAALACPALAALYRAWFLRFFRRRWPKPPPDEDEDANAAS